MVKWLKILKRMFERQRPFGNMIDKSKKLRESAEFKKEIETIQQSLQKREEKTIAYKKMKKIQDNIIHKSNEIAKRRQELVEDIFDED